MPQLVTITHDTKTKAKEILDRRFYGCKTLSSTILHKVLAKHSIPQNEISFTIEQITLESWCDPARTL